MRSEPRYLTTEETDRRRPSRTRMRGGFVYFLRFGSDGPIKIGWARNVALRVSELQTGSPVKLHVLASQRGTEQDERDLHRHFAHLRLSGEWFAAEPELLDWVLMVRMSKP